jgi:hypothetical protein
MEFSLHLEVQSILGTENKNIVFNFSFQNCSVDFKLCSVTGDSEVPMGSLESY